MLSKHGGLLTREGVHQNIATLQQSGLRLGEDVGGRHGPGVVTGHTATKLSVKCLEVARVEEVEGAGLRLGGGSLGLEPVGGRSSLRLLRSQRLELLVVKSNKRLDSLRLCRLLGLLGEHSLLLGHRLTGGNSLRPLDWNSLRLGNRLGPLDSLRLGNKLLRLNWGGGHLLRLLRDKVLLESEL